MKPKAFEVRRVVVLGTGGTIAGYVAGEVGVADLLESIGAPSGVTLVAEQVAQVDSKDMSFNVWRQLARRCAYWSDVPDVIGVVITHGTDTLEETAFFLHLTLECPFPVVLTGSMRHSAELSGDGPGNLRDAAQVALRPSSAGRGPLVVFGGDVFDARTVTKVHTSSVGAFGGYPGPIGRIDQGPTGPALRYFAGPEARHIYAPPELNARVEVLYAYAGWQGEGYAEAEARADGLVIAALGTGNLPAELLPLVEATHKPVVIATRTHAGPVLPLYGYAGGGATLRRAGAISASFLNAHKARLLLMLLLSLELSQHEVRRVFEEGLF